MYVYNFGGNHKMLDSWISGTSYVVKPQNGSKKLSKVQFWIKFAIKFASQFLPFFVRNPRNMHWLLSPKLKHWQKIYILSTSESQNRRDHKFWDYKFWNHKMRWSPCYKSNWNLGNWTIDYMFFHSFSVLLFKWYWLQ